jgi:protein-disulfide isomerase
MSKEIKILGVIVTLVVIGAVVGTFLYNGSSEEETVNNKPLVADEALVRSDSPTLGAKDAKVTVVEFLDPECEACAAFHPIMKKVLKDYDGKVRLVVRYMPLHPNSLSAATFTEAAGEQGKYWEAQELLFKKQPEWGTKHGPAAANAPKPDINALFRGYAEELKLNTDQMNAVFAANKYAEKLARDKKDGESLGVRQTPTIYVNSRKLQRLSEPAFTYLIEEELKRQ